MILIIDFNKRTAESISDIFYYMGIISKATMPNEALTEISSAYKAVLISNPDSFPDIIDFVSKLTSYSASIPIYSISDNPNLTSYKEIFRKSYHSSSYSSAVVLDIAEDMKKLGLTPIGTYRLAGIDASCDMQSITSFDQNIPFTKTEAMILRYLITAYPIPQSPKRILKYAFKPTRKPDITSIRTHVSVMNKKFREVRNRNVILSIPEQGYVISTPEILRSLSEAT